MYMPWRVHLGVNDLCCVLSRDFSAEQLVALRVSVGGQARGRKSMEDMRYE